MIKLSILRRLILILLSSFFLCATTLSCSVGQYIQSLNSSNRDLWNTWEIHREVQIPTETYTIVKDYFPSFLEYHDIVMFHPKIGYYASGRVSFENDYQTFPIVLAPLFGHMVAEQIFFMWDGMQKAGTLNNNEQFTIAEFGAGDGVLAESIMSYLKSKSVSDKKWRQFENQVLYICCDRSPALNKIQRDRNARFGKRFSAKIADATNITATFAEGSIKGVFLSNELPDAFSVHKIILSAEGIAEVAFVPPALPAESWNLIRQVISAETAASIKEDDVLIETKFHSGKHSPILYMTKKSWISLLEALLSTKEYESIVNAMQFHEVYVPATIVPELAAHLKRYARTYANVLAKNTHGLITYINPGLERLIHGVGKAVKAGYVLTIDYGTTWDGILAQNYSHLRTYGPAHPDEMDSFNGGNNPQIFNPYLGPTLNDITTDVNFSLMAVEGEAVGLKPIYYGSQRALQSGTGVILNPPANPHKQFNSWVTLFQKPSVFKIFVQQKEGTDISFSFPDNEPEPLGIDELRLTQAKYAHAARIRKTLIGTSTNATRRP